MQRGIIGDVYTVVHLLDFRRPNTTYHLEYVRVWHDCLICITFKPGQGYRCGPLLSGVGVKGEQGRGIGVGLCCQVYKGCKYWGGGGGFGP